MKISVLFGTLTAPLLLAMSVLVCVPASAQVIVSEDFESYANDAALYSVWSGGFDGFLIDETFIDPFADPEDPDDLGARAFNPADDGSTGQGVNHLAGSILEYVPALNGGQPLLPTAEKSIVLQGDIFDTLFKGNKRVSIGLRNASVPVSPFAENLIELGQWNSPAANGYAYRGILFPGGNNPNWAPFDALPIGLDRPDDADTIVTLSDIGEVWSTYRAIITPDTVTYEIDLFRDGLTNDTPTTGTPGVDMSITFNMTTSAIGFDSLRIGGPSGSSSPGGGVVFDNVLLASVDSLILGDYNKDGTVNAADYTVYRDTLGTSVATAFDGADGNGDTFINALDYPFWANNFGNNILSSLPSSASAVPEPTTALLACLAGLAVTGLRRSV